MNCAECKGLLDAYCDGELDLVRHIEVEAHLGTCPSCAQGLSAVRARGASVRGLLPRFSAPPELRGRIRESLRSESRKGGEGRAPVSPRLVWRAWNLGGIAASLAAALLWGYLWGSSRARSEAVLKEAITEHVRSLQDGHLVDVASTDRRTVKPWFAGKLDFSPPVADLADAGFPLAGGRLDAIDGRTAAALVFHKSLHSINVFIWPDRGTAMARGGSEGGFSARAWTHGGLNFLAVSDIPAGDLERFVGEFRKRTD